MNTIEQMRSNSRFLAMGATIGAYPGMAQQAVQPTFASAAEASQKLSRPSRETMRRPLPASWAERTGNSRASGEPAIDKLDRETFIQKYQQMHRVGRESDGSMTLYIGAENWPFPIPLVQNNGAWRFDSDAGQKEVLFRRSW